MLTAFLVLCFLLIFLMVLSLEYRSDDLKPVRHISFEPPKRVWVDAFHPPPSPGWLVFECANQAMEYLDEFEVKEISLDYHLGSKKNGTGHDVLLHMQQRLEEGRGVPGDIQIHTRCPIGRSLMSATRDDIRSKLIHQHSAPEVALLLDQVA